MPEVHLDNPAGRLLPIAQALSSSSDGVPTWSWLGSALQPEAPNGSKRIDEVARRLALAMELPHEVEAAVSEHLVDVDPEVLHDHMERVRKAIAHTFSILGKQYSPNGHVDAVILTRLEDWSRALHRRAIEGPVSQDTLTELERLLGEMRDALDQDDDLDPTVEAFLREQLAVLARTVADLRIRGARALDDALTIAYGALARSKELQGKAQTSTGKKAWGIFLTVIGVYAAVASGTNDTLQIPSSFENTKKMLDGPPAASAPAVPGPSSPVERAQAGH